MLTRITLRDIHRLPSTTLVTFPDLTFLRLFRAVAFPIFIVRIKAERK